MNEKPGFLKRPGFFIPAGKAVSVLEAFFKEIDHDEAG
jgi:hypothetical protein